MIGLVIVLLLTAMVWALKLVQVGLELTYQVGVKADDIRKETFESSESYVDTTVRKVTKVAVSSSKGIISVIYSILKWVRNFIFVTFILSTIVKLIVLILLVGVVSYNTTVGFGG